MSTVSEEEQQKKNTDCVYFLASPLTCKKGDECEFRHSESARINPRDCWFWISGNCLNANCSFRHPPLEGRPTAPAVTTATAAKSRVPCYYYAQGYCAKGDKCGFQHGVGQVATTETAVSHKLPKPKSSEPNEKQVSTSKGNGSVTSKPLGKVLQQMQAHAEMETHFTEAPFSGAEDEPGIIASNVLSRMPEGSGSSAPSRSRNLQDVSESNRSKRAPLMENMPQQPAGDNFVHLSLGEDEGHEVQTEDISLHDGQPEDEMVHQTHSGEERIENGTESEELLEESSFDVLVDDGGDQIIYTDEFDYLPSCDVLMDPVSGHIQGRMVGAEDLADFEYDPAYFDGTTEYELAAYDSYQQVGYEHLVAYDYAGERAPGGWTDRERLLRDRREAALEEQPRRGVSSNDLRNHLVKRRRAERSQKHGDDHYRRRHQDLMANGSQERYGHHENFLQQQESLGRRRKVPQAGTRSNRQNYGQQESLSRQSHGQLGFLGNKRAYRDVGSDYDRNSSERSSYKRSRNVGEHAVTKAKKEHGRLTLADTEYLRSRGSSNSNNKRGRPKKEDSSFAGPKSLAQIRAEKLKSCDDENATYGESNLVSELEVDQGSRRQVPPLRSQISPALKDHGKAVPQTFSSSGTDFKGPKPLSEILKEKRKGDVDGEQIQETRIVAKDLKEGANSANGALISGSHVIKSENHVSNFLHNRTSYDDERTLQGGGHLVVSPPYNGREQKQDENEEFRHGPDSLYDPAEGEAGDSAMDDVEFDDDEEDDFAKKLGGFFS